MKSSLFDNKIEELDLSYCTSVFVTNRSLWKFDLSTIKVLGVAGWKGIDTGFVQALATECKELRSLDLSHCSCLNDELLYQVLQVKCPGHWHNKLAFLA